MKPRLARVILAVLSSVILTLLVVVPLAFGAHSARVEVEPGNQPALLVTSSTPPVGSNQPAVPDLPDQPVDDDPSVSEPPRIATEVLPSSEVRGEPDSDSVGETDEPVGNPDPRGSGSD